MNLTELLLADSTQGKDGKNVGTTQDARELVKQAFSGHDEAVERVYAEHPSFRDLCQDYRQCTLALQRWRRDRESGPVQRSREYAELLNELAKEIESWLADISSRATPPMRMGGE